ncbi:hypothetical protein PHYPSEUDO_008707 [Phytophthora pseudosyringae]|uniref:RanBD1 domain-containing protein n=1 Tax=Phytophthora pseudosyringae TaxID=221518 RepID=A0A8T1VE42_9STRA|nr:hypothetical protein PHYPSEUDO_008707 [Phytophthora pseudosyringae]
MAKRRNENGQMRREEYDAADNNDVSADSFEIGFQRASDESIRKRKIVKARVGSRPPVAAKPKAAAPAGDIGAKSNPFGGFQGLTAAKPAGSANPFTGFSGLTGTAEPVAENARAASSSLNAAASGSYQQAMEGLNKEFLAFVNGQSHKNPSASWVAAVQDYLKYAGEIATMHASTKPVAINEAKRTAAPAPFSFNATPSFGAASSPAPTPSSSSLSFGDSNAAAKKTEGPAKSPASTGFSFVSAPQKSDEPAKTAASGGFSFGGSSKTAGEPAKSPAKPASGGFSFGGGGGTSLFSTKSSKSEEKTTPAFSFGGSLKPADSATSSTAATGGFSLGNLTAPKNTIPASTGGFGLGASAPTSTSAAAGDEDEENVGREEATVIIKADSPDDDCTFEAEKAKIFEFKKDEKRWADKGVHPLKVLVSKETKSARILVRNEIGKIVLNASLYKGMAVRPHEAKGKKTGVTLALQVDGGEMAQFLLKVNAARVDDFIKALEAAASSA